MSSGFETRQLTVGKLFSDQFKFSFPPFQRPYRWTREEAETLLRDLVDAATVPDSSAGVKPYFLGSVVVSGVEDRALAVIDGRQRLTTLFILFAVLRDLESEPSFRYELNGLLYDDANLLERVDAGYRLRLGVTDARFFDEWIGAEGATLHSPDEQQQLPERHARLSDVARVFRERLLALERTDPFANRAQIMDFVLHHCELIVVRAADEEQALRLFQVLNSRGMELSQTDLARPQLMAGLSGEEQLAAAELWDRVDEKLGSAGVDTLLRALVFVLEGDWISPDQPFADPLVGALQRFGVGAFIARDLEPYAEAMLAIRREELQYADRKRNPNHLVHALGWLGRNEREWQEWLPVALECVVVAGEDDDRLYSLLQALDRLFWVMFLCDVDEHQRRTLCFQGINDLRSGADPLRAGGPFDPPPRLRAAARLVLSRPFDKPHRRGAVLRRLELQLGVETGQELHPNIDRASAEFVLPQTYPAGTRAWTDVFDREAHREAAALLGNGVLLSRPLERASANAAYSEKKKLYTRYKWPRPFETVKDLVARDPTWTPQRVHDRTARLLELLCATWGL